MEIQQFADNNRLKTRLDDCGEKIIPGKNGQIYEYSDTEYGVMFMPKDNKWTPKTWGNFKRTALPLGMILRQNGDSEGCLSFDPLRTDHIKLALKIARIKKRRVMSEKQREAAFKALQSAQK